MDEIDRATLARLAGVTGWPCVSIVLPVSREPSYNAEDRLRLRSMAQQAVGELEEQGMRRSAAETLMGPVLALAADETFWTGGFDGVAAFLHDSVLEVLRLPVRPPASVVVGDRLYLRPVYPALAHPHAFWALALDRGGSRLFHASGESIEQVDLPPGTPLSFADETRYDVLGEPQLQQRTLPSSPLGGDRGAALFHGHGGEKDLGKAEVDPFIRHLERGVTDTIGREHSEPLMLFGVDYLVAAYRAANGYPHLADRHVEGASGHLSPARIREQALDALRTTFSRQAASDLAELQEKMGTGLASDRAGEIAAAAAQGRVKTIHFDDSTGPWGVLDRDSLTATESCEGRPRYLRETLDAAPPPDPHACGWDLVDLAAAETLLHGGEVESYTGEDAPVHGVAAVFRY